MFHNKSLSKCLLLVPITLVLLFSSMIFLQSTRSIQPVFANGQPVFHPGYGIAAIDGVINTNEWMNADSLSLPMYGADTPLTGTFYVMQTDTDLYFGFTIDDDEYTQDPTGKWDIYGDLIIIDFDDNNSGALFEIGENKLKVYSYEPWFIDAYFYLDTGSNQEDTEDGGVTNGSGFSTRPDDDNHFEASFPLCSGDTEHDFCLQAGDILGFRIEYFDAFYDPEFDFDNMYFPGTEVADSLALIQIGDYTTYNLYLPLVLK